MNTSLFFAILASLVYIIGAFPYMHDTIKGKVTPHPFTWGIWLILIYINLNALYLTDAGSWAFFPVILRMSFILFGTICGILMIHRIKINWFDYFCLILSLFSVLIFYVYGVAAAVFITVLTAMFVVAPTIKKIWINPNSEDALLWFTAFSSQILLLLSIENQVFENSVFWMYSIFENISVVFLILLRRKYLNSQTYTEVDENIKV